MPLPAGAHVKIGDKHYRLDEAQEAPYRRFSRSIFADIPLVGSVGQNLQPGRLVWNQTNFDGEGQVVLDPSDAASARRFYKSSGLDFRTAGQFQLNKASQLTLPTPTGSSATTVEAAAGMSDVTGTSTSEPTTLGAASWELQTSGTTTTLNRIARHDSTGLWVAVGNSGLILTSTDGTTWTSRTSGVTTNLTRVAVSSGGTWVITGASGTILTSTNGTTWTKRTSPYTGNIWGVAHSGSLWVIGGNGGNILTSSDAISWSTTVPTAAGTGSFFGVAWSTAESQFVAVGTKDGSTGAIMTSPNGTTWTARTVPASTGILLDVVRSESDDLWLATSYSGIIVKSTDGATWTQQSLGVTQTVVSAARSEAEDIWMLMMADGVVYTANDASTWSRVTTGLSAAANGGAYSPTQKVFIVVGNSGAIARSLAPVTATTDRQLNATGDVVKTTSNHTPGAYTVTVDFYAYRWSAVNVAGQANPTITVSVYNVTDSTTTTSTTATLSSTSSLLVASLSYTAVSGKSYSYRVTWTSGTGYKPLVDKVVYAVPTSSGVYTHEAIQLGQGGSVWAAASSATAATNTTTYTYNFSDGTWTNRVSPTSTDNKKPLSLAHTDKYEYVLLDNSIVYQATTSAVNAYISATTATARGIAITQNRLFVLGEDATNGVVVYLYGIDQTSYPVTATNSVTVDNGKNTPDATLRQRMTSSPSGAVFFVNYSTRGVVYECDASDASPIVSILAELPEGVKATSILHTGGLTFVAAQFLAPTGKTPRSALFMIDQNGVIQRIGWFRREEPSEHPVIAMQAYQNDLWMLQGNLVWRYSLTSGGLFLEHELAAASPSSARGIAVTQDYVFAAYASGIYVVGNLATYLTGTPSITSSVYDFGLPYEQKLLQAVEVTTQQLPAGTQVLVEYQLDQNGVWVTAGTSTAGTLHRFLISDALAATRFYTLQTRVTPVSVSGSATPVVKGITTQCYTTTSEELFDLALLTTDQDSETPLAGADEDGADLAAYVWDLANSGSLVTLLDGYSVGPYEEPREFLCKVESVDHINVASAEGSVRVRLRVVT